MINLIRNPFDSLAAERKRRLAGSHTVSPDWDTFVTGTLTRWVGGNSTPQSAVVLLWAGWMGVGMGGRGLATHWPALWLACALQPRPTIAAATSSSITLQPHPFFYPGS